MFALILFYFIFSDRKDIKKRIAAAEERKKLREQGLENGDVPHAAVAVCSPNRPRKKKKRKKTPPDQAKQNGTVLNGGPAAPRVEIEALPDDITKETIEMAVLKTPDGDKHHWVEAINGLTVPPILPEYADGRYELPLINRIDSQNHLSPNDTNSIAHMSNATTNHNSLLHVTVDIEPNATNHTQTQDSNIILVPNGTIPVPSDVNNVDKQNIALPNTQQESLAQPLQNGEIKQLNSTERESEGNRSKIEFNSQSALTEDKSEHPKVESFEQTSSQTLPNNEYDNVPGALPEGYVKPVLNGDVAHDVDVDPPSYDDVISIGDISYNVDEENRKKQLEAEHAQQILAPILGVDNVAFKYK